MDVVLQSDLLTSDRIRYRLVDKPIEVAQPVEYFLGVVGARIVGVVPPGNARCIWV